MTFDAASNTYTMMYWPAEYLTASHARPARYLGALKYQAISNVGLTYKGVAYTWDPNGGLVGSNWKNGDVTLVRSLWLISRVNTRYCHRDPG